MINLTAKKVQCPKCQQLRKIKGTKTGTRTQFTCVKCNHTIWQKEGFNWKHNKPE